MVQTFLALLALPIAGSSLLALARIGNSLRGTTLGAPWKWSLIAHLWLSFLAILAVANFDSPRFSATLSHFQYLAGVLSFMPVMAVLGASRPRDRGWPVVTFGLLVILLLPSAESWLYRPGLPLGIEGARSWFLVILIGLGLATYGLTRYWASVVLAAAQWILLYSFLPDFGGRGKSRLLFEVVGAPLALVLAWAVIALARRAAQRTTVPAPIHSPLDPIWLDFRDSFGMLWGLRVVERMNASANMYDWSITLSWSGFVPNQRPGGEANEPLKPDQSAQIQAVFENLLLRFVSAEWIAERKRGS